MGDRVCKQCGANKWNVVSEVLVEAATDRRPGMRRRECVCRDCGFQDGISMTIPKYDRKVIRDDGTTVYFYNDRSGDSGGGGGSSSGDGGGGASW